MPQPYVGNVLDGWTTLCKVWSIQKIVEDALVKEFAVETMKHLLLRPSPAESLKEDTKEERATSYWNVLIKERAPSLKMDDLVFVNGKVYRIKSRQNDGENGFTRYSATEYEGIMQEVLNEPSA